MSVEYEFQIDDKINKSNIVAYIEKLNKLNKFKNKIIVKSSNNNSKNCDNIYKCYSSRELSKIVKKILKNPDTKLIYIIKNDEKNNIYQVLFDIDTFYFNSDIATEKENKILGYIYNQNT